MGCYWLVFAAGARAGAAEAAPFLGGEFVDDLESADVGVGASLEDSEPLSAFDDFESAPSDDFETGFLESDSFESEPFSPARA